MTHDEEIEARLQVVAARAHRSLAREELELIRDRIKRDLDLRNKMRTLPLANDAAPDSGFLPSKATMGGTTW